MGSFPTRVLQADDLEVRILKDKETMGACAADHAACVIEDAITRRGKARIVVATGASQFAFFKALVEKGPETGLEWSKVEVMHLDEYAGMGPDHPASFRRYLHERFVDKVKPAEFFGVLGEAEDLEAECERYSEILSREPIDLGVAGIGENGHLAFNDPPVADFDDPKLMKIVDLDEPCRRQQFGEGWFPTLDDVPSRAISMSIRQILQSRCVVCTVPDARKAVAVRNTLEGEITNTVPASILREHPDCHLFLDEPVAGLLERR